MKTSIILNMILACFLGSCLLYDWDESVMVSAQSNNLSNTEGVSQAFAKIESTSDKLVIYKLFAGSAEYLKNCKSLQATQQFDPILGRVQSSYGWNRDKYPEFTDAVSAYLVSVDYNNPKPLTTEQQRQDFANIFQSLAEATKYE